MSQSTENIGRQIKEIALKAKSSIEFPVMSGVVKDVDNSDNTVTVLLTCDEIGISGVIMNVLLDNFSGVYMIPEIGADCDVYEIDGNGKWGLFKASKYSKVVVNASTLIQFNDGSLGGLTKTLVLKTELDKVKSLLQHIVTIINGAPIPEPGSGANSALQTALKAAITSDTLPDFSSIENTLIKQ